mmetsp:Transcript_12139/g.26213  ORF Transcript_12139/g.26213 Transcript_12139/m.26213 type:complete len:201 (+) Transcript_12139:686-1288(+)
MTSPSSCPSASFRSRYTRARPSCSSRRATPGGASGCGTSALATTRLSRPSSRTRARSQGCVCFRAHRTSCSLARRTARFDASTSAAARRRDLRRSTAWQRILMATMLRYTASAAQRARAAAWSSARATAASRCSTRACGVALVRSSRCMIRRSTALTTRRRGRGCSPLQALTALSGCGTRVPSLAKPSQSRCMSCRTASP